MSTEQKIPNCAGLWRLNNEVVRVNATPAGLLAFDATGGSLPIDAVGEWHGRLYTEAEMAVVSVQLQDAERSREVAKHNLAHEDGRTMRFVKALRAISEIRDNIIGRQAISWSEHIYPIVAALEEAGFKGAGYEVAREQAKTMNALVDELTTKLASALKRVDDWRVWADRKVTALADEDLRAAYDQELANRDSKIACAAVEIGKLATRAATYTDAWKALRDQVTGKEPRDGEDAPCGGQRWCLGCGADGEEDEHDAACPARVLGLDDG